jgi:hypothetical protein
MLHVAETLQQRMFRRRFRARALHGRRWPDVHRNSVDLLGKELRLRHSATLAQHRDDDRRPARMPRDRIDELCERHGEKKVFSGKPARQIQSDAYYGAGIAVVVTGRDSADRAIAEI